MIVWNSDISAARFTAEARRRNGQMILSSTVLTLVLGSAYTAFGKDGPLLPLVVLVCLALPVLLWHFPRAVLYIVFAAACLFELFPSSSPDSLTERVPFFWNVNTIFQIYMNANVKAVPLNVLELILLLAGVFSLWRAVFTKSVSLRGGALMIPFLLYAGFVVIGWMNGLANGGDFKLSLQEVRAQFYFVVAYFMAVNLIRDNKQVNTLFWMTAIGISLKGALYTFRRYVTMAGQPLPDQGVGSHEEAFLFIAFVLLLFVVSIAADPAHKALRTYLWLTLPVVILGNLATNRRAGTAALVIAVPMMMIAAYRGLPNCRRSLNITALLLVLLGPAYYFTFRNSEAAIAQPARAIRSHFSPDARDASSNAYRDAENACIMATVKSSPVIGYGYGRRFIHAVPMADISESYEWWDLIPHNQILWVWMRVGTFGFIAFWLMNGSAVILCCHIARNTAAGNAFQTQGLFGLAALIALLVFGSVDILLTNPRSMVFVGIWLGVVASSATRIGNAPRNVGSEEKR